MAKLLVHESAGIREFEIIDNEVHMGRELDNTLRLPDPSISRHHCVIRKVGGGFEIQDLQSSNGVLVNGNRVQASPCGTGTASPLARCSSPSRTPGPRSRPPWPSAPWTPPAQRHRAHVRRPAGRHPRRQAPGGG